MRNILIYTALWKRPEITKICFEGIKRLQDYDRTRFNIKVLCVVSSDSDKHLCNDYGFNYCTADNKPLGKKWNTGLRFALDNLNWEYLIQIGSDDLLDGHLLESYELVMQKGWHHAGVRDLYFVEPTERKAIKYTYSSRFLRLIGAGRIFSRTALDTTYPLWDDNLNKSLDHSSENRLILAGYPPYFIETDEPRVIDIKSVVNIWPYSHIEDGGQGEGVDIDEALSFVGVKERKLIDELCTIPQEA